MTEDICAKVDSIWFAAQLGRLDFVSLLLAVVALILGLGGIFAFFNFRNIAKRQASEVAEATAKEVADKVAHEYMSNQYSELLRNYLNFASAMEISDKEADEISKSQS